MKPATSLSDRKDLARTECWKKSKNNRTWISHQVTHSHTPIAKALPNRRSDLFQQFNNVPLLPK